MLAPEVKSNIKPNVTPIAFEAAKSPRQSAAVVTGSEADAKALLTDALYVSDLSQLNQHLTYLNSYSEVVVAIPDPQEAHKTAYYLRTLDKHLPIAVVKETAWNGADSIQALMTAQNLRPLEVADVLSVDAEYVPDGGCYRPDSEECIDLEAQNGILTQIYELDRELGGLRYGELSLLVGCSGHGKSTLSDQFVLSAVAQGIKTCVFSGELSRAQHNTWLFGQAAGKYDVEWVVQKGTGKKFPVVKDAKLKARIKTELSTYTDFVDCDEEIVSFDDLMRCFYTHVKQGYKFFIVDNIMALTIDAGDKEYSMQADMVYRLLRFAAKWRVHVMALAHPKKSDSEIRGLNDIYGTSKMANWAHEVLAIHKLSPEEKKKFEDKHEGQQSANTRIKILKSRVAPTDEAVFLRFDETGRRFYAPGRYPCFPWENMLADGGTASTDAGSTDDGDLPIPEGEQESMFEKVLKEDDSRPAF